SHPAARSPCRRKGPRRREYLCHWARIGFRRVARCANAPRGGCGRSALQTDQEISDSWRRERWDEKPCFIFALPPAPVLHCTKESIHVHAELRKPHPICDCLSQSHLADPGFDSDRIHSEPGSVLGRPSAHLQRLAK